MMMGKGMNKKSFACRTSPVAEVSKESLKMQADPYDPLAMKCRWVEKKCKN